MALIESLAKYILLKIWTSAKSIFWVQIEVTFLGIDKGEIMVDMYDNGIKVPFDHNGTMTSENDYTSACMLFPSSDHKRWDDVTYVPASKQVLSYEEE